MLLVFLAAWPAHAAIAVVQAASCIASASTTCTAGPITTTNGNLFIASSSYCCAAFTSVTDSKLNVYVNAITDTNDGAGGTVRQDYKDAGAGGASHSFTLTGASASFFGTLSIIEVSGAQSSPLDQTQTNSDAGLTSHTSTSTSATSQANELLIGAGGSIGITTYTTDTGAGWTEQTNIATDASTEGIITGSQVVSAIGTYAYTYTTSLIVNNAILISTWKAATANRQRCIGCGTDKKVIGQ